MAKNPKRPRDPNQLARLIVDITTGEFQTDQLPDTDPKGSKGGQKGGPARAAKLTPEERVEIAKKAARARWNK